MARVVLVHGAFHELWGPRQVAHRWIPALRDGLTIAGTGVDIEPDECAVAFYGDLFRPGPDDVITDDELREVARRTGMLDAATALVGEEGLPALVEQIGREQLRRTLSQAGRYFDDPALRDAVQARVHALVGPETRLVVAHSLGTIVSYEALSELDGGARLDLVTIGSPLGHQGVVGRGLQPALVDGRGARPPVVRSWTNVIAKGDMACDGFPLDAVFPDVAEQRVDNGHRSHDPEPYLCAAVTGAAVAAGLSGWG